jgi:hypothetical protein
MSGDKLKKELLSISGDYIFYIRNAITILVFELLHVRCPGQLIVVVHGEVDVYVHDGANTIHEQKRPHLTCTIVVLFEKSTIC